MYHVVNKATGEIVEVGLEGADLGRFDSAGYEVKTGQEPVDRRANYYDNGMLTEKALVTLSANKTTISADGVDAATVTVTAKGGPASIDFDVGGTVTTITLTDGSGEFGVSSAAVVEIPISPADSIHYQGETLTIIAE